VIICVGGTKGGTGKSTVATNLAVMLATSGRDVLLVDADEQGTSTDFTNMRNTNRPDGAGYTCISLTGRAVVTEIRRLTPKYQDVVIDVGGGNVNSQRGALAVCDLYLVPLAPRLGVDHVIRCSLAEEDGVLTGVLVGGNVRGPEKVRRLQSWLDGEAVELWAYGDSSGDDELLALADHPTRVRR